MTTKIIVMPTEVEFSGNHCAWNCKHIRLNVPIGPWCNLFEEYLRQSYGLCERCAECIKKGGME